MKTFSLSIPTKTYLRKYLHKRFGYPIAVNSKTHFGMMVQLALEKKVYQDSPGRDFRYASFIDKVDLAISESLFFKLGYDVPKDKAILINRYFEIQFEEDLYRHCQLRVDSDRAKLHRKGKGGCGYDKAINEFAELHGIELEVDISFECLKKSEYRHRKKIEKNFSAIVPSSKHLHASPLFA